MAQINMVLVVLVFIMAITVADPESKVLAIGDKTYGGGGRDANYRTTMKLIKGTRLSRSLTLEDPCLAYECAYMGLQCPAGCPPCTATVTSAGAVSC